VLAAYAALARAMKNLELHVFPGVLHGYMMPDNTKAFEPKTRKFSMARALAILDGSRRESGSAQGGVMRASQRGLSAFGMLSSFFFLAVAVAAGYYTYKESPEARTRRPGRGHVHACMQNAGARRPKPPRPGLPEGCQ